MISACFNSNKPTANMSVPHQQLSKCSFHLNFIYILFIEEKFVQQSKNPIHRFYAISFRSECVRKLSLHTNAQENIGDLEYL